MRGKITIALQLAFACETDPRAFAGYQTLPTSFSTYQLSSGLTTSVFRGLFVATSWFASTVCSIIEACPFARVMLY